VVSHVVNELSGKVVYGRHYAPDASLAEGMHCCVTLRTDYGSESVIIEFVYDGTMRCM
jgi:hypothetical protein